MAKFRSYKTIFLTALITLIILATNSYATAQNIKEVQRMSPRLNQKMTEIRVESPVDSGGPGYISLPSFAFKPMDSSSLFGYLGIYMFNPGSGDAYYVAPVIMPHGASITQFLINYTDYSSQSITAELSRVNFSATSAEIVAQVSSEGSGEGILSATSTIMYPVIDQQNYMYYVLVTIPGNNLNQLEFIGVRIDYGYPSFLPTVVN